MSKYVPKQFLPKVSLYESKVEPAWTYKQVANYMGVSVRTIQNWKRRGLIPFGGAGRSVRFSEDKIREIAATGGDLTLAS